MDLKELWDAALDYEQFVKESRKNCALWEGVYRTARVPDWAYDMACKYGPGIKLLVLAEDWCGDASNTVPILARMGHEALCLDMKVIRRDEHPEVMDRFLTNGARAIPIVIVLDDNFNLRGHWGPRPSELQAWVQENKDKMPADERYKHVRRWYARDHGETTLREVLALLENSAGD
ncbi:MAG: thioredoxin family protein [Gemmatimonadales bacterium]